MLLWAFKLLARLRAAGDRQRAHAPIPGVRAQLLCQLRVQLEAAAGEGPRARAVLPLQGQEPARLACTAPTPLLWQPCIVASEQQGRHASICTFRSGEFVIHRQAEGW